MRTVDQIRGLQDHPASGHPVAGLPAPIWMGNVTTVNADGTIDVSPAQGRAMKAGLSVPSWYTPTIGDQVLVTYLQGNELTPIVLQPFTTAIPPA